MEIDFDFACRDDCLDMMVPSDLRRLVKERDVGKARIAELEAEKAELEKQEPTDIPIGAIENGKEFLRRLAAQFDYDDGRSAVAETAEYHEVMRCFNAIEEYFAQPVQPAVPDEWGPIETAPKDGEEVWLFCPNDEPQQVQGYFASEPEEQHGYWRPTEALVADVVGLIEPTHWIPLPAAPKEK